MDCPKCKVPMIVVEYEGVELDHCVECNGTWFDRDELELLFEDFGPEALGLLPRDMESLPEASTDEAKRRCPLCRKKMRKVRIEVGKGVLIDVCPRGQGLWFDEAEVAELAGGLAKAAPGVPGKAVEFMGRVFGAQETSNHEKGGQT